MNISIIILAIVFILIIFRRIGNLKLQIWQIMLFGAIAVLLTGEIKYLDALKAVNIDVILFLFGMFVIGRALEESGYLSHLSYKYFRKAKNIDYLFLFILFGAGIGSAFLMNDTIAIIGTPVVLLLSQKHNIPAKPLLLTLAFAVTIGSVMSPIGNPQNLLIALNGNISNSFVTFAKYLFIPTIINLFLAFFVIKFFYKEHFHKISLEHSQEPIKDKKLAVLSKISIILILVLIVLKILIVSFNPEFEFKLTYIALISAIPILFSPKRFEVIKKIDWSTLIFFASMFILMQSVWDSGFFQSELNNLDIDITSIHSILAISVLLSQLISNVPLVALYLPVLMHAGVSANGLIALAVGSTIAGNLLILGAASNIIIIQNAEKKGETINFFEFAKVGIPLTIINILVYYLFLSLL
ncbi:MAG: anion transporter [Nanoarchaeota archaeon]|nr:anion transporter [Nanoarchaeota archaeon]